VSEGTSSEIEDSGKEGFDREGERRVPREFWRNTGFPKISPGGGMKALTETYIQRLTGGEDP